jgi:hypothetical protein
MESFGGWSGSFMMSCSTDRRCSLGIAVEKCFRDDDPLSPLPRCVFVEDAVQEVDAASCHRLPRARGPRRPLRLFPVIEQRSTASCYVETPGSELAH